MKITVIGAGYVGLATACLLSKKNSVVLLDISEKKVSQINNYCSPIKDKYIEQYFATKPKTISATLDKQNALKNARFIVIATSTDYHEKTNQLDTTSVEENLKYISKNFPGTCVIIKSTVPIGFTKKMQKKFRNVEIIFSPEFLREGYALYDLLYPSRIIVGASSQDAKKFANLLKQSAEKKDVDILFTGSTEAECIKLFSNTYLAMRVAFFNELDTFADLNKLDTKEIIQGVSLDPRICNFYNNPSFAYGGYCLPKDSKQLAANYKDIPEALVSAIVKSNKIRLDYCIKNILAKKPKTVGIFRLTAKEGASGFRFSAISHIIKALQAKKINIIIYEPIVHESTFQKMPVQNNLSQFKAQCDLIIANRMSPKLNDVKHKVYTRDVFGEN